MNIRTQLARAITRRHFFRNCQLGLGSMALGSMLAADRVSAAPKGADPLAPRAPMHAPRAKHVIYVHLSGSPPQHETFDYKPVLAEYHMKDAPESLTKGQRFAFIKGTPKMLGPQYKFRRFGQSGAMICELLPHIGSVADDIAIINSMHTNQFNHAPAELYVHTGEPRFGFASMGSWVTYGLGSENANLPGFVVLVSGGTDPTGGKSLWGSAFLPSVYQGVQCRTSGAPILYSENPAGMDRGSRRRSLDALRALNEHELDRFGDAETLTRIEQYELAYRMQVSVPEVMDVSREPEHIREMYGLSGAGATGPRGKIDPGFARNCLLARRMVESGVRFVQLYDWGWDMHGVSHDTDLITGMPNKCNSLDRPFAALVADLKQRGLLEETLIILGGEFGRTSMNEARNGSKLLGRDHHPHCFSIVMAGGGIRGGVTYGKTDDFSYFITENKMTVHDLQFTILHQLGLDPEKLSYPSQGLNIRLIGPADGPGLHRDIML